MSAAPHVPGPAAVEKAEVTTVVRKSFLQYALAVISSRALPSVRDGLKPVQRRILWTMHKGNFSPSGPYVKSARVVGDALGKYHPHADGSIYGALVNLTDEYRTMPLIDTQGNFGTRGEDKAAAMRYTECKLHRNAVEMFLHDLDEPCVDFQSNYDQSLEEPVYFPSRVPMLLINGSLGIAVSVATAIPSHNLAEVIQMTTHVLDGSPDKAFQAFLGPDWKSGGRAYCPEAVRKTIFYDGRGTVRVYGRVERVAPKGRSQQGMLKIWEIPWTTNRQDVLEKILALKSEIPDLQIEKSSKDDEPKITLLTREDLDRVEKLLYKKTGLASTYSYNMVYLDGKIPQQKGILHLIESWISFRKETLRRKFTLQLEKVTAEVAFLSAKKKLTDELFDDFITVLRTESRNNAKSYLMRALPTDSDTADRILAIRISSFAKDSDEEFNAKLNDFAARQAELTVLLQDDPALVAFIRRELKALAKLAKPRQTEMITEDLELTERTPALTTRRLAVVDKTKLVLGSGERYSLDQTLAVLSQAEVFRLRVKDLRKYRDGATVDVETLGFNTKPILNIFPETAYALLTYRDGRALWLDFDKLKLSSAVRSLGMKTQPMDVFTFDRVTDDFVVALTMKGQIIVNRLSELGIAESRSIAKLRLAGLQLKQVLIVPPGSQLKVAFKAGLQQLMTAEEFYRGKFSLQAVKVSSTKEAKSISLVNATPAD